MVSNPLSNRTQQGAYRDLAAKVAPKKERDGGEFRTGERGSGGRFIICSWENAINKFVERCPSGTGHLVGP